jgi:hypothetical protein
MDELDLPVSVDHHKVEVSQKEKQDVASSRVPMSAQNEKGTGCREACLHQQTARQDSDRTARLIVGSKIVVTYGQTVES